MTHPTSPAERDAHAALNELMRQLVLERRYDVLVAPQVDGDGAVELDKDVAEIFQGFEVGAIVVPALEGLRSVFDRIVVRADTMVFNVACLRVVSDGEVLAQKLPLERLARIVEELGSVTGSVGWSSIPVTFQMFEIHPSEITRQYIEESKDYCRQGGPKPNMGVGIVALETQRGTTWSNFPGLIRLSHVRLAKRAFRDRDMTRRERSLILSRSGFQPLQALMGFVSGTGLGVVITILLRILGTQDGSLYGGVALIAAVTGAAVSVQACRVIHATIAQATVPGTATMLGMLTLWWLLGFGLSIWWLVHLVIAIFVSVMVGAIDNPQGRRPASS